MCSSKEMSEFYEFITNKYNKTINCEDIADFTASQDLPDVDTSEETSIYGDTMVYYSYCRAVKYTDA